jgi:hypothetical protein
MKLIDILLENITPEDWPAEYPFAGQDKCSSTVYFYDEVPGVSKENKCFKYTNTGMQLLHILPMGKKWKKNIVNRAEFVERYNKEVKDWIIWEGGDIPVAVGTRVDVQYQDKKYNYGVRAGISYKDEAGGSHELAIAYNWESGIGTATIIRYRVCPLTTEEILGKIRELLK